MCNSIRNDIEFAFLWSKVSNYIWKTEPSNFSSETVCTDYVLHGLLRPFRRIIQYYSCFNYATVTWLTSVLVIPLIRN